jgi:hypothetical protein
MSTALAPRPKNEDRRVVAVKRTGIIDGQHRDNFSIFCEVAKELEFPSVYLMKTFNAI